MLASARLGERSPTACAVTSWQGRLYLAWTGSDARVNVASSADGAALEGKRRLEHRTYRTDWEDGSSETIWLAPALVGAGDALYLAWTGTDGCLNVQGADRTGYAEPVRLAKRTSMAPPSVTVFGGDLIVAWTGTDRRANFVAIAGDSHLNLARLP